MENEIVLYQPDSSVSLEVTLGEDTVWLSQRQIAELFGTKPQAITRHLKNIYDSGELDKNSTCSKMEQVQIEGTPLISSLHFTILKLQSDLRLITDKLRFIR